MKLTPIGQPLDSLHHYRGAGFPEGKVAAPVGSIYTDLDAKAGAIRWIKTTGTGNTGWQVEYGDTGWRDVRSSLLNGWAAQSAFIRRSGGLVEVRFDAIDRTLATSEAFYSPLPGFQPGQGGVSILAKSSPFTGAVITSVSTTGASNHVWRLSQTTTEKTTRLHATYMVNDTWPTTLPGIPA